MCNYDYMTIQTYSYLQFNSTSNCFFKRTNKKARAHCSNTILSQARSLRPELPAAASSIVR